MVIDLSASIEVSKSLNKLENESYLSNPITLASKLSFNSVSFKDGLKYYSNYVNAAMLRITSDELREEYGISVLEEKLANQESIIITFIKVITKFRLL